MDRVYNFSSGPACLPDAVLLKAQKEMYIYQDTGMSVMEMSHRSKAYLDIFEATKQKLIQLMQIPEDYSVLFVQGGATTQFALIPMNFLSADRKADYILSGLFASKALKEAQLFGDVRAAGSSENDRFSYIPETSQKDFRPEAQYVHMTSNNTVFGTQYHKLPDTGDIPLFADMSSDILSGPCNVSDYGLIYAGAQKNIGPAGLTIVIVKKTLLDQTNKALPTMMSYRQLSEKDSMINTPPTYSIYIAGLVFDWLKEMGGVSQIAQLNQEKASLIYDVIDNSKLYKGTAIEKDRSVMNITFVLPSEEQNIQFVKEAEKSGLVNLKGHRDAGGIRASIYNAMPLEGVQKLAAFMKTFELQNVRSVNV